MTDQIDSTNVEVDGIWLEDGDCTFITTGIDEKSISAYSDGYPALNTALIPVEELVIEVLSSDDPAFILTDRLVGRGDCKTLKKDLKRLSLARYFTSVIELFELYSVEYEYTPHIEIFFNCCFKLDLGKEWFGNSLAYTTRRGDKPMRQFELFNELIELIRIESRTAEFDGKISDREYNSMRNFKSAVPFATSLFAHRLLVLRVDFSYLPVYANSVSPEEAKDDLARFFCHFRHNKELTEHLEGYLWKWEFSHLKKMHCHLFFFYHGGHVKNDAYWGSRIGMVWKEVITNGRGMFYNGNLKKHKARFEINGLCAIGMIDRIHEDPDKDTGKAKRDILLNVILKYLLKSRQYMLATRKDNKKDRIFGKGRGPNWKIKNRHEVRS